MTYVIGQRYDGTLQGICREAYINMGGNTNSNFRPKEETLWFGSFFYSHIPVHGK